MPTYDGLIENLVAGDFRQIPWQINNVPAGGSVTKGWLTVKTDASGADPGLFQKIITSALDVTKGQITNSGLIGNVAIGYFNLLSTETILMSPLVPYAYDMQFQITMTDASTRIETPEVGTISTIDGVTDAVA